MLAAPEGWLVAKAMGIRILDRRERDQKSAFRTLDKESEPLNSECQCPQMK